MTDSSRFDGSDLESGSGKKTKKPMMEKLRRERINRNLNEMKVLVLEALHRDSSRYSKMEKADILEMTVKYLKQIHFEMKTRKDAAAPTEFNVVSSSYQAPDALAREAVLRANQHAGPRPRFVQNFHDNSLSQQPKPIAPALPTTTSLLPATSVAMATRSNRTLRWVPYPSPPSSPTGSKVATSYTRLQRVANVCPPMVASPCIDNPSAIPISGVSFPSDRLLWRRW